MRRAGALVLPALLLGPAAVAADWELTGHLKTRLVAEAFPRDSLFRDLSGSTASGLTLDGRLNVDGRQGPWSIRAAGQLVTEWGDRVELDRRLAGSGGLAVPAAGGDSRRLMDLTEALHDEDRLRVTGRLDRLSLGYTSERTVVRIGRQALTWGNGLYYTPLDIVNPFDPATIDTEFKAGDDLVYAQYLKASGDDVEAAVVFRRDPASGEAGSGERTAALRYNGLRDWGDFSLLAADHYGDGLAGAGFGRSIGGAVWRADVSVTFGGDATLQAVTNLGYSWVWGGRNVSGVLEYYHSGFGLSGGDYPPAALAGDAELLERLGRGELFGVGRNYLVGGLTIEWTPLLLVTPSLFANVDDGSALLQLVARYSAANRVELIAAVDLPLGPDGSEFGGLELPAAGRYLSRDAGLFAQVAWYF